MRLMLTSALNFPPSVNFRVVMGMVGIEPTRPCGHRFLRPARLPVPPRPRIFNDRKIGRIDITSGRDYMNRSRDGQAVRLRASVWKDLACGGWAPSTLTKSARYTPRPRAVVLEGVNPLALQNGHFTRSRMALEKIKH